MRKRASVAILAMAIGAMTAVPNRVAAEMIYGTVESDLVGSFGFKQQLLIGWDSSDPTAVSIVRSFSTNPFLAIDATPYGNAIWLLNADGHPTRLNLNNGATASFTDLPPLSGIRIGFELNPVKTMPPVNPFYEEAAFEVVSDFNQSISRVRLGSNSIDTVNPALAYAIGDVNESKDPSIFGIAYTNNVVGATSATLYGIDSTRDVLVTIDVTSGALHTVGPLGIDVISHGGFDISGRTGSAYATMTRANASQSEFWSINLSSGAATSLGAIGGGITVTSLTVVGVPEPASFLLMSAPLAMIAATQRRR